MLISLVLIALRFRRMQRAVREGLGRSSASDYQSLLGDRTANLIDDLIQGTTHQDQLFWRFCASTLIGEIYGLAPNDSTLDSVAGRLHEFVRRISSALLPGAYLVEFFPFMQLFPSWMARWKRGGIQAYHEADHLFEALLRGVEERSVGAFPCLTRKRLTFPPSQTLDTCLAGLFLTIEGKSQLSRQEVAWLSGSLLYAHLNRPLRAPLTKLGTAV